MLNFFSNTKKSSTLSYCYESKRILTIPADGSHSTQCVVHSHRSATAPAVYHRLSWILNIELFVNDYFCVWKRAARLCVEVAHFNRTYSQN